MSGKLIERNGYFETAKIGWRVEYEHHVGTEAPFFSSKKKRDELLARLDEEGQRYDVIEGLFWVRHRLPTTVKAPPVSCRPKCPTCKKPLRPKYVDYPEQGFRAFKGYWAEGHFCGKKCAAEWANAYYTYTTGISYPGRK